MTASDLARPVNRRGEPPGGRPLHGAAPVRTLFSEPMAASPRRPGALTRLVGRAASAVLDPTVVLSFDRTGFERHALGFRPADLEVDLAGRVCLVTGANSGIGYETALALAQRGARVWLLCRNQARGAAARAAIERATGNREVRLEGVDVAELSSVRALAARFTEAQVDVLVHNAGVLPDTRELTGDGIERTFATNVVGPFLLTALLLSRLRAAPGARVITVSSGGMYPQRLDLDDLGWRKRAFDGVIAYANTKRAEVVLNETWARRLAGTGVTFAAMHPGWADTPAVRSSLPRFHRVTRAILRTPAQGADTVVWLAAARGLDGRTGLFWFDRAPRTTHLVPWTHERRGDRRRLWSLCCELTGFDPDVLGETAPVAGAGEGHGEGGQR